MSADELMNDLERNIWFAAYGAAFAQAYHEAHSDAGAGAKARRSADLAVKCFRLHQEIDSTAGIRLKE